MTSQMSSPEKDKVTPARPRVRAPKGTRRRDWWQWAIPILVELVVNLFKKK